MASWRVFGPKKPYFDDLHCNYDVESVQNAIFWKSFFDLQIKAVFRIPISVPSNWVKTPLKLDPNRLKNGLGGQH